MKKQSNFKNLLIPVFLIICIFSCKKENQSTGKTSYKISSFTVPHTDADINIIQGMYYNNDNVYSNVQNFVYTANSNLTGSVSCNGFNLTSNGSYFEDQNANSNYNQFVGQSLDYSLSGFGSISDLNTSLYMPSPLIPNISKQNSKIHVTWTPDLNINNNILLVLVKSKDPNSHIDPITIQLDSKLGSGDIDYSNLVGYNVGDDILLDFVWGSIDAKVVNGVKINQVSFSRNVEDIEL